MEWGCGGGVSSVRCFIPSSLDWARFWASSLILPSAMSATMSATSWQSIFHNDNDCKILEDRDKGENHEPRFYCSG